MSTEKPKVTDSLLALGKGGLKKVETKDIKVTTFDAPDDEPVELVPCLFIGSLHAANNHHALEEKGITHVLTLSKEKQPTKLSGVEYTELLLNDSKEQKLDDAFKQAFALIDGVIASGGSILVHCLHGQSRSGAVCIGYLMSKNKQPFRNVWRQVKDRRSLIHPNENFQQQLLALGRSLGIEEKEGVSSLDLDVEEEEEVIKKPKEKRESRLSVIVTAAPTLTRMVRDRTPAFKWDSKTSSWQEARQRTGDEEEEEEDDGVNDSIEEESEIQIEEESEIKTTPVEEKTEDKKTDEKKEPKKGPLAEHQHLRIVTYNILFADRHLWARFKALVDILKSADADIICLQEVRVDVVKRLVSMDWVRAKYYVSDQAGFTLGQYGVLILSRVPIEHFVWYPLPSNEQKRLVRADFNINGKTFSVVNGQYDSGAENGSLRAEQLTVAKKAVAQSETSLLVGDFNFDAKSGTSSKELEAVSEYTDVWPALHPSTPGHTVDYTRNSSFLFYGADPKVRYDRFFLKSFSGGWRPKSIKIIGDTPIIAEASSPRAQPTTRGVLFPSHHFGLLAEFEMPK